MKTNLIGFFIFCLCSILLFSCKNKNEQWSHFRGNQLDGITTSEAPVNWSEDDNIEWKTALSGYAWSSPVVWDDQIWLTSATKSGDSLFAFCVDFESGEILAKLDLFHPEEIQRSHPTNSYATSTPCIDEDAVYVHYGTYGTASINTKTFKTNWSRTDMNCEHMQGAASSLALYKNLLIVHLEGTDVQDIYALDKRTGTTVWKVGCPDEKVYNKEKPVSRKSYQTPKIITVNGEDQLITNRALFCVSYNPLTGEENWRFYYGEDSTVGMPLFYEGDVLFNSGWVLSEGTPYFARMFSVDPTGKGDITESHLNWMREKNVPQTSTPVIVDSLLFMVHERGELTCLNPKNGQVYWEEKLDGNFNSSPVSDGINVFFTNTKGETTVVKAIPVFQKLAENKLDGMFKATPAILRNSMIMRSDKFLYKIIETKK